MVLSNGFPMLTLCLSFVCDFFCVVPMIVLCCVCDVHVVPCVVPMVFTCCCCVVIALSLCCSCVVSM